jgi:putative photosynthetic complex assembly protein
MSENKLNVFPVWLRGVLVLTVIASLSATAWFASNSAPLSQAKDVNRGQMLTTRALLFQDADGGRVIIKDAHDESTVAVLTTGQDGFMRSVMRGLARQRLASGHDDSVPFELTSWESGYLSLNDPVTGRFIELTAFGPDNAKAFARLLQKQES